ncbi:hypothetical protein WMF37_03885 [Sorangium sp. So ce291]|uniref:hypothetical protein n=1 Tax=Sorangium sp. So ce291 TaxID=3133294 RepID=UPI003F6183A3
MSEPAGNPRVGMMATVRNRRRLVVSVDPFDAVPDSRLHLFRVEYTDPDGTLLREREHNRAPFGPTALPRVADQPPMPGEGFDPLDRAETHALQARLGLDSNPWPTLPLGETRREAGPKESAGAAAPPADALWVLYGGMNFGERHAVRGQSRGASRAVRRRAGAAGSVRQPHGADDAQGKEKR